MILECRGDFRHVIVELQILLIHGFVFRGFRKSGVVGEFLLFCNERCFRRPCRSGLLFRYRL